MANNKHLTLNERSQIQSLLMQGYSFKRIASSLNCNCSTISKEIRKHRVINDVYARGRLPNRCVYRKSCDVTNICSGCYNKKCRSCRSTRCNLKCEDYQEEVCDKLDKPPYVCNGCPSLCDCTLLKYDYNANDAYDEYKALLSTSRSGISISEEDIQIIDVSLSPRVLQGQSIYAALLELKDTIMYSERTIYKLIDLNLLSIRNIDLPRKVAYRPRKQKSTEYKVDKRCREGRSYDDFKTYVESHPDSVVIEGDSVIGAQGSSCLLTLMFVDTRFMIAVLRDRNDSISVTEAFQYIYHNLGEDDFSKMFQVVLFDNGSEFTNPQALEELGMRVFYCDPGRPDQKGTCEKNHVEIRKIIPKGKSMEKLSNDDIGLVMSHVNSYPRKKLNDKSPLESFSFLFGNSLPQLFQIAPIALEEIILKPKLLSR